MVILDRETQPHPESDLARDRVHVGLSEINILISDTFQLVRAVQCNFSLKVASVNNGSL